LDGHVVLARELASAGHFPAVNVLESASRVRDQILSTEHKDAANALQSVLSAYHEKRDMISVGAYQVGTDPLVDTALRLKDQINRFLRQSPEQHTELEETRKRLMQIYLQIQEA